MVGMEVGSMHHDDLGDLSRILADNYVQDREGNAGRILRYVHRNC